MKKKTLTSLMAAVMLVLLCACGQKNTSREGLAAMNAKDINGTAFTADVFKENRITLVNVFATWCTPCIAEFPHLEELPRTLEKEGVGVVAVVSDAVDEKLNVNSDALTAASAIAEYTGVTFPLLVPDQILYDQCVKDLAVVPQSFFVDQDGKVISEVYQGARDTEAWAKLAREVLDSLD